jgi:acyl-CoA thioesterase
MDETRREPAADRMDEQIARFNAAPFAVRNGLIITGISADGAVMVTMEVEGTQNAHGTVHGGAIFSVADHAFGIASNLDGRPKVGVTSQITYLAPATATGGPLIATTTLAGETMTTVAYQVIVSQNGRCIALFYGNAYLLPVPAR